MSRRQTGGRQIQRLTVYLTDGSIFDLHRTGLFVITRASGSAREGRYGQTVRPKRVLARGRAISGDTLRVTRGEMSPKQVRALLHDAGYDFLKVKR